MKPTTKKPAPANAPNLAPSKTHRRLTILLTSAAIIFAGIWIISFIPGNSPTTTGQKPSTAAATPTTDPDPIQPSLPAQPSPQPTSTLLEYLPENRQEEIIAAGTKFITAYSGRTWNDPALTTWLDRTTPLAAPEYQAELEKTYRNGRAGLDWQTFKDTKSTTSADLEAITIIRTDNIANGQAQLMVTYTISTLDQSGTVTAGPLRYQQILAMENLTGTWLAASLNNASGNPDYTPAKP